MASTFKAMDDTRSTLYGSIASFDSDSMLLDRSPVNSGFLMSVMVDARGGAMKGWHSGVRIIVPPGRVSMPTRVTCKLIKKEKLHHPPPLMEGEALASRLLQMGPKGARFLGPVVIEVPHFASLRGGEREILVLRSDNGAVWQEHVVQASEEDIINSLNGVFDGEVLETSDILYKKRVTRILAHDFPKFFALVTRVRQDTRIIGPESGLLTSSMSKTKLVIPEGALTKTIKVGVQVLPISPSLVTKLVGRNAAVSPLITIEPRRRKFHKSVTLTVPAPRTSAGDKVNSGGNQTMRLLCSITGGIDPAQWLDITEPTRMSFAEDTVSFTTNVSGRYWLVDCQSVPQAVKVANDLYKQAIIVPYMAKFVVFAKRQDDREADARIYCMTDDRLDRTLETQEKFTEIGRTSELEVLEGKRLYVELTDNLTAVKKDPEDMYIDFYSFCENKLALTVRLLDAGQESGSVTFATQPPKDRATGQSGEISSSNLKITLPKKVMYKPVVQQKQREVVHEYKITYNTPPPPRKKVEPKPEPPPPPPPKPPTPPPLTDFTIEEEPISRAELRLTDIADTLHGDWVWLAGQLGLDFDEIIKIQDEYTYISERTLVMLHRWIEKKGEDASGNELERALRTIGREDVIQKCMYNIEEVLDEEEKEVAREHIELTGMYGDSPATSPTARSMSLDVSYDEAEFKQMAEKEQRAAMSNGAAGGRSPYTWHRSVSQEVAETDSGGEYADAESDELKESIQEMIDNFMESPSPKTHKTTRNIESYTSTEKTSPITSRQSNSYVTSLEVTRNASPKPPRQTSPYFEAGNSASPNSPRRNRPYLNKLDGISTPSPKSRRHNSPYFNTISAGDPASPKSSLKNKSYITMRTTTWTSSAR